MLRSKGLKALGLVATLAVAVLVAWSIAIGPRAVWRVLTHGTTTVWDHLEYPGRQLTGSPDPRPWPTGSGGIEALRVELKDTSVPLDSVLAGTETLAMVVVSDGELLYDWYAPNHGPRRPSMVFSVTKSVLSLLIGAAVDDGLISSVDDPVTAYLPRLSGGRFDDVSLRDLLAMNSGVDYVESDNPFGAHVEFNYSADLTADILALRMRDRPEAAFRYKSADYALLGLALERALEDRTITDYLQRRLWDPLGAVSGGVWSTDHDGGLERTWCCLAVTAPDLARLGELVLSGGTWHGERLLPESWIRASLQPRYARRHWPEEYGDSPLVNYGFGWWLTAGGAAVALGKNGQYVYVDPARDVVIVRLGEGRGDVPWITIFESVASRE